MQRTSPRSRPLAIAAVIALVLIVVVADATAGVSPAACGWCHGEEREALAASSHASNGCLSCHLDNGAWSLPAFKFSQWLSMYPKQLLGVEAGPSRPVARHACASCHEDMGETVESRGLRINHVACAAPPTRCTACHSVVAHGQTVRWGGQPVMEACVSCHLESDAPGDCDTCHAGRLQAERLREGPWRVTHGPQWSSTHALGDARSCVVCHEDGFCARCHGVGVPHSRDFGSAHGSAALASEARCDTCHSPATFCDACHGMAMPHPEGFLQVHSTEADTYDDERCLSCHARRTCDVCHETHVHPGGAITWPGRGGDQ
ncbi:MAG: hypothetical protein K0B85_05110 [Coriobacteriia bacterium]|nr:hypothetical protein [Coriobacteriia bacterium]